MDEQTFLVCSTIVSIEYKESAMITSKDNEFIKHVKSLNQKKYRDEYQEYFIEGIKMVSEAIFENAEINKIILCKELLQKEIDTKNCERK